MPVSAIPFAMPQAAEIPAEITASLQAMEPPAAVARGLELLQGIDAAATMIYECVDANGALQLGCIIFQDNADALTQQLGQAAFYGQPLDAASDSLTGRALDADSALLVLGQAGPGDEVPLPEQLKDHLLQSDPGGNIGFLYILPLQTDDGRTLGSITLIRPAAAGPLNHEQPNLTQAVRQILCDIVAR